MNRSFGAARWTDAKTLGNAAGHEENAKRADHQVIVRMSVVQGERKLVFRTVEKGPGRRCRFPKNAEKF